MAKKNMRRLSPQLPIREKQNHDDMSLPTIMANILPMLPTKRKTVVTPTMTRIWRN
jgi:hypothetical protein